MSKVKYPWRTKPYAHQLRAIKFAIQHFKEHEGVAFLMEPRTGKTKTTIDTLSILHYTKGVRRVLIVCPNRVLGTWVEELHTHCPLIVNTIVWDADARKQPIPKASATYDLQVVITNFEAFSTPGRKTPSGRRSKASGRFKHRAMLRAWLEGDREHSAIVVDESHKIKNPSGKSANMIVSMRDDFRYRFLLTGTPVTKAKRAHDVYMQWQLLNPKRFESWGATAEEFRNHIGRWISANGFPQYVGPRETGMADLRKGLHADSFVVKRADCFDLPPREEIVVPVELGPDTAKAYDDMAQTMVAQLRNGDVAEAAIPLVVTLRLLQITSGFVGIQEIQKGPDGKPKLNRAGEPQLVTRASRIGTDKLDRFEELLVEEIVEKDQKVVIAARFVADLNAITELCRKHKIPTWSIRGGMSREDTDKARREFNRHEGLSAIVVQPQAASLGIDLSSASTMIWFSMTPNWTDWSQCCDRIALSRNSTTFYYMIAKGTVDELLMQSLEEDTNMSQYVLAHPDSILRHSKGR